MHRVHLLGGADATGSFNDTLVYYVAGEVDHGAAPGQARQGLGQAGHGGQPRSALGAVAWMTLMPDHFWSDRLRNFDEGEALMPLYVLCDQQLRQHSCKSSSQCAGAAVLCNRLRQSQGYAQ